MRNMLYFLAILALILAGMGACYFCMKTLFTLLENTKAEEVAPAIAVVMACGIMWPVAMLSDKLDKIRLKGR